MEERIFNGVMKLLAPVLMVLLLTIVGGISSVYFTVFLPHAYPEPNILRFIHIGVACWFIFNILFNYFRIMFVDPGSPTKVLILISRMIIIGVDCDVLRCGVKSKVEVLQAL
jgi:hypothetical protein